MEFNFEMVPKQNGCRWFLRKDGHTRYDRGFRSKKEASDWINALDRLLDWRTGYTFALRGSSVIFHIVDKKGNIAKP
ncbi:hypothetical protein ACK32R_20925 [Aeromonas dhakensis]|jgi:hypothetical protein|uniref:hypothetical protein n=1 Tax=Aeromonas dhakensis TaxID=196024 RepID=UPI003985D567